LLLLPGCGSSDNGNPIPSDTANRLIRNIQAADSYSQQGRCDRAHTKVRDARFVLTQVPSSVDVKVRQGIGDGLQHLDSLITSECQTPTQTQTQTQTTATQTTPTQTQTTQTETSQTQTTPTETTPTQTTPTDTSTVPTSTTPTQTDTGTSTGNGGTPTSTGATGGTG
jgi:cell division protein FtsN